MPGMSAIQVKDVPEELHEALRQRAAERGVPLGQYVLELIRRDLQRPRWETWVERHPPIDERLPGVELDVVAALDEARAERDAGLDGAAGRALGAADR